MCLNFHVSHIPRPTHQFSQVSSQSLNIFNCILTKDKMYEKKLTTVRKPRKDPTSKTATA